MKEEIIAPMEARVAVEEAWILYVYVLPFVASVIAGAALFVAVKRTCKIIKRIKAKKA
ncbi:MAG: hypothetical protein J6X70_09685 [Muribaculaceae bacterium]|nr:hypothetical protein [Muribaculaceae bacterium]